MLVAVGSCVYKNSEVLRRDTKHVLVGPTECLLFRTDEFSFVVHWCDVKPTERSLPLC